MMWALTNWFSLFTWIHPILWDFVHPTLPKTHALLPFSLAIDAGSNAHYPPTDQRGFFRPFDGNKSGVAVCDISAYEANEFHYA